MPIWRWLVTPPADGATNMAVDVALAEAVRAGAPPAVRLYAWSPPCLSLGRHQASAEVDRAALAAAGVGLVRRPTGGAAVLHDEELTYAVVVPARALGGPRVAYRAVHAALAAGLRRLGVPAELRDAGAAVRPSGACFAQTAPGEIVVAGRKLLGSAQAYLGGVLLQHGSLPLAPSPRAAAFFDFRTLGTTLAETLGRPTPWDELVAALRAGFEEVLSVRLRDATLTPAEAAAAARLRSRFAHVDAAWHA